MRVDAATEEILSHLAQGDRAPIRALFAAQERPSLEVLEAVCRTGDSLLGNVLGIAPSEREEIFPDAPTVAGFHARVARLAVAVAAIHGALAEARS